MWRRSGRRFWIASMFASMEENIRKSPGISFYSSRNFYTPEASPKNSITPSRKGAEINASDIVLTCSAAAASSPTSKNAAAEDDTREKLKEEALQRVTKSKSPVKHLFEAMTRRKHTEKVRRVPHALDFVRPRDCPVRDPPEFDISDQCGSPLFHSPSGSVSTMESSSRAVESKKTGFVSTLDYCCIAGTELEEDWIRKLAEDWIRKISEACCCCVAGTELEEDRSSLTRSWCDRYGDVVLDVVHKEFKGHVKDMEAARKTAKEKRRSENDENSGHRENGATTTTTISKATSKPPAPQQQRDQDRSARPRPRTAADPPALPRAGASRRRTRALRDEQRRR